MLKTNMFDLKISSSSRRFSAGRHLYPARSNRLKKETAYFTYVKHFSQPHLRQTFPTAQTYVCAC